jgi:hypothetical protein
LTTRQRRLYVTYLANPLALGIDKPPTTVGEGALISGVDEEIAKRGEGGRKALGLFEGAIVSS